MSPITRRGSFDPTQRDDTPIAFGARERRSARGRAACLPALDGGDFSGSMRDRLRRIGSDGLADLLLKLAGTNPEAAGALLKDLLSGAAAPGPEESGEPYMVGASPTMQEVYDKIRKFAVADAPVLVTGESGTGKELVARAIHERSGCRGGPFMAINCAALPASLIAAELFGYEKGAFTGATQRHMGLLESGHGGTVFLDEIGDLPLEQQAHFLRFLQESTLYRVGGTRPVEVKARVVCATNVDLRRAIAEGRFREDLFYRLNVLSLRLPPLRDRGGDLELIAMFFLRRFAAEHNRSVMGFDAEAWHRVRSHPWPGNVRELIACVRRAVIMADGPEITARDLGLDDASAVAGDAAHRPHRGPLGAEELRTVLDRHEGNITATAEALGVSRMTVYRTMRRFGIGGGRSVTGRNGNGKESNEGVD